MTPSSRRKDGCRPASSASICSSAGCDTSARLRPAEPGGVGADDQASAGVDLDGLHLDVRDAVERLAEPHLPEGVDAAPLQALAAEGAGEVVVRLQHRHAHAPAGEQVGQRHAGRPRPHDDDPARLTRHDHSHPGRRPGPLHRNGPRVVRRTDGIRDAPCGLHRRIWFIAPGACVVVPGRSRGAGHAPPARQRAVGNRGNPVSKGSCSDRDARPAPAALRRSARSVFASSSANRTSPSPPTSTGTNSQPDSDWLPAVPASRPGRRGSPSTATKRPPCRRPRPTPAMPSDTRGLTPRLVNANRIRPRSSVLTAAPPVRRSLRNEPADDPGRASPAGTSVATALVSTSCGRRPALGRTTLPVGLAEGGVIVAQSPPRPDVIRSAVRMSPGRR